MANALLRFLLALAEDPLRAQAFKANPDAELAKAKGLSAEQRDILRSRDPARIRAALVEPPPERDLVLLTWLGSLWDDETELET